MNLFYIKEWKGKLLKEYLKAERSVTIGKLVGDQFKYNTDSIKILISISSILPVIFATVFLKTGFILNN